MVEANGLLAMIATALSLKVLGKNTKKLNARKLIILSLSINTNTSAN